MEQKVENIALTIATHTEQIKTLFNQQEALDEMVRAVTTLAVKMENVERSQSKIEQSLSDLKSAPARNWQTLVAALISGVAGAMIGLIVSGLGG